jgi:putative PEP-CTERM system histidine kinase
LFVKFSDTSGDVGSFDSWTPVDGLIAFWSYALAACLFVSVVLWRLRSRIEGPTRLLIGACFASAVWASISAVRGPTDLVTIPVETIRNLSWMVLLHAMSGELKRGSSSGIRLVFWAVALVIGVQLFLDLLMLGVSFDEPMAADILASERLLRITMAAGALVLVHNIYGQAAPESRLGIRPAMLGLTLMWGYDLNLYTLAYLGGHGGGTLLDWRGFFMMLVAPFFVAGASGSKSLRIRLSRAATFQSLSLLGICAYFVVMAVLATALRRADWDWSSASTVIVLGIMLVSTAALVVSRRAHGWVKVKLAKHLFEHRYDYRAEWLRFTDTLGQAGADAPPLSDRIIKAFADIVDAPGGILLVNDGAAIATAASWNWPGAHPPGEALNDGSDYWQVVEQTGRIVEFEGLRLGWASWKDRALHLPAALLADDRMWAGIPLIHHDRLTGVVVLGAPDYKRPLDWEDFDLLRAAGRHAASTLAEAHVQQALSQAQRFEEFNRRFAFILHDVKNLVSQLTLVARNAERHANNPEFRADMVATLQSSVSKMNELLERLSPHSAARVQRVEAQPLRPLLISAIATKRGDHDVRLLGDANIWAMVDGTALEHAVGHLIQNAAEACSTTMPVTLRVARQGPTITISVSDKGVGMDSDFVRTQLFQPFSSTKSGGFGIGCFEARSLIAAMGGRLSVDSRPAQGTTFTISLPSAEPAKESERKIA